jgi:hypothetical protein
MCLIVVAILVVFSFLFAWAGMMLWNYLTPYDCTFWQAYAAYWLLTLVSRFFTRSRE